MGMRNKSSLLLMIMVGSLVSEEAIAAQHVVGGSQGWEVSADFNSWASGQTFKVGDQLVFKYSTGLHSVVELGSESEYKNCDIGSAVNSLSGGNNVVKLDKPGNRYFACGTSGHCEQGMKIKVTTLAADATSTPTSSTPSSHPTSNAPICLSLSPMVFMIVLLTVNFFWGYQVM